MKATMKVNAAQKVVAEMFTMKALQGYTLEISNDFEHKIAERLVEAGMASITKKKNYGRIAEIKGIKEI